MFGMGMTEILVILVVIALTGPFIGAEIYSFTTQVYSRVETGF